MSVGLGLLHCLISSNINIVYLDTCGVSKGHFINDERIVYKFVKDYFFKYGKSPKLKTTEKETKVSFPEFPKEPIKYWLDNVCIRYKRQLIIQESKKVIDLASDDNLVAAVEKIFKLQVSVRDNNSTDGVSTLSTIAPHVIDIHDQRQKSYKMVGVPFGLPYLDSITDGAQGGDTIALAGLYGSGKTYVLLSWATHSHKNNAIPMVCTFEMSDKQCARRILALRTGVYHTNIRLGKLSHWARKKLVTDIEKIKEYESGGVPFYLMQGGMNSTVEELSLRINEFKPDIVYVDGAYMLKTSKGSYQKGWERVAETAEGLKMVATDANIPIIATYQFNAKGDIGHSGMAIKQLASIVMTLDDEDSSSGIVWGAKQKKVLELIKGREGEKGKIGLDYDMNRMSITQSSIISGYGSE